MKKILLSVAPVAATDILINPRAIAKDVIACSKAGAGMVHLHVRDLNGRLTSDLTLLEETIRYIKEQCDIVIEISTGGVSNLTIEERCAPVYPTWVEANSLNVGSVNLGDAVYQNPIKDVHYCVEQIIKNGKIPEIEVFEIGMINTVRELALRYDFIKPILFAIVLGHIGAMPATIGALKAMLEGLYLNFPNREEVLWGITHAHRKDWEIIKAALDMGASSVRIGFEDSDYLNPLTQVDNNAVLVAEASDIIKSKGMMPATPDEIRTMLHIPKHPMF
ncbi:3-keto-5-aminohexanoate cleavage protein [Sporanaerobium hydrogeniformans]|uniref:3-keto-5-aminohexanoate cleavage protein n=1 Tax=Sporanaerobium hydrogeniformans TaxID=3072179 RepID=A0AC61D7A3_9FIRM|nr:3-keto-5-aminohexanoate cleavage protein [Sporanaerobium hydrogeniformans]PHV69420.1 3-keto-5-aminohexanoate cleavage protein [Sporanaerobium hydrogeniformans]